MQDINILSLIALAWFASCWFGYGFYAKKRSYKVNCLASIMHSYRKEWALRIINREVRTDDVLSISALDRTASFFASSALIILAALFTALGTSLEAISVLDNIPYIYEMTTTEWQIMIIVLIINFVYAFFKLSWSIRQFSFCIAMVGALPPTNLDVDRTKKNNLVTPISRTLSGAAYHFNLGLRAYYFSLAVLSWILSPVIFMFATAFVVFELHRREFKSSALKNMLPKS